MNSGPEGAWPRLHLLEEWGMSEAKVAAKAAKKAAKAEKKLRKKAPAGSPTDTPAQRSAAAAERQVKLQRYRVCLALITAIVAAAALLATTRPWERFMSSKPPTDASSTEGGLHAGEG